MVDIRLRGDAIASERFAIMIYWVLAAMLVGYMGWAVVADPLFTYDLNSDLWEHSAAIREWMNDLWHPKNPHLVSEAGSPRYMPYYFLLAVMGKILGLEAIAVLKVSALINIALLTLGIFLFFRTYFRSDWAAVIGLIVLLTGWGSAWSWSNVYQLRTLPYVAPYPSTFSFALTLVCLWLQTLMLRSENPPVKRYIVLAVLVAIVVASHPLTGSFAVASLMLLALFHPGVRKETRASTMIAVAFGLVLAELWPYYSVWKVTLGVSGGEAKNWIDSGVFTWSARPRLLLEHPFYNPVRVLIALGPALTGVICLIFLARRREHWFILFGALTMIAPYAVNLVYPIPLGHRFLLFAIFFFHLAMVWATLECLRNMSYGNGTGGMTNAVKAASSGIAVAIVAGLVINLALVRAEVTERAANRNSVPDDIRQIVRSVPRDGIVMARPLLAWPIPTFSGKVVSLFHPNPMVPDRAERDRSVAMFFDPATPEAERTRILRTYQVSHVLIDSNDTPVTVMSYLSSVGVIKESLGRLRLIDVRGPTS